MSTHTLFPKVENKPLVLVTGANGFLAAWVVRMLLESGYAVRGTVRSEGKGVHLKQIFKEYVDEGSFEVVVVEDITKEGAFDEAVKGVSAIEHTASPFHFKADDPQEIIAPAVDGTLSILKSASKLTDGTLRRIIITGSCASIFSILPEPKTFTEADWNEQGVENVRSKGRDADAGSKYRASKVLAERAAWDFYNTNRGNISWDMVVLNPPVIYGPNIHELPTISSLNTSSSDLYHTLLDPSIGGKTDAQLKSGLAWIDVRDIAEAHVRTLQKEEAGGERLIVSAGEYVYQDWIDAAASLDPHPVPPTARAKMPKGTPGVGKGIVHKISMDASKSGRILGMKYRTMEETVRDVLVDFVSRGWC